MKRQLLILAGIIHLTVSSISMAQEKQPVVNDSNTPLHLLEPAYQNPYGIITAEQIKKDLDRIFVFLDRETPARVIHTKTGQTVTDYKNIDTDCVLDKGSFRLASYEWGVTYSGMLEVAKNTGDEKYLHYVYDRFRLLAETAPYFRNLMDNRGLIESQMRQMLRPHALDDAGAICAAMIRLQMNHPSSQLQPLIDNYMDFIMNKEYRLADGTFARKRPQMNTLWLDDMYMSLPAIAEMGRLTGEQKYYDEAVKQIRQFSERMFVKEKGLYRHGWVEDVEYHPAFHWGRANGWALLTMTDVLDVLPDSHPGYQEVMQQYKAHLQGIAACQSGEGFWHQLLDRNDSYLETSATAIFVYCIARAINNGWIDAVSYGPVAQLGWHAVRTKINGQGQVEDVCVGTGMAFDPAFYYYRPVNVYAAHGYGPVLLAGAEMMKLIQTLHPRMNDSAVQYYMEDPKTGAAIFGVDGTTF